ncbi:hypothetical protein FZ983_27225 [Azospirillum sp. B21]|uniref:hypothetical protein n=1 Tax=Azospirillum sp. B21 TaxID=2607496 RepID=UPI0011EEB822|nr:hypothetical protein [Azospirillum sp. B21]KAA0574596.1 hypothetical protein FZ983_27225 [Azospirillum sp. B21]
MRPEPDPYNVDGDPTAKPTPGMPELRPLVAAELPRNPSGQASQDGNGNILPAVIISGLVSLAVCWAAPRYFPQFQGQRSSIPEQQLIVIYDPVRYAQGLRQGLSKEEIDRRLALAKDSLVKLRSAGALVLSGESVVAAPEDMYLRNHELDGLPASGGQ